MTAPAADSQILEAMGAWLAALAELHIEVGHSIGPVRLDDSGTWIRVGAIVVHHSGVIEILPCRNATLDQISALIHKAEHVRMDGPVGRNWRHNERLGHLGAVYLPLGDMPPRTMPTLAREVAR